MKITDISLQARNPDRVNVSVDGKYRFSLDIAQVTELGIRNGENIDEDRLASFEQESTYGKLYVRTLEYCLSRPHSVKEVRDYLRRKTFETQYRSRKTGEVKVREGVSHSVAERVLLKIQEKGYADDRVFAKWWIENRNLRKGTSQRKLRDELAAKAVPSEIINEELASSERDDVSEIVKIINKKRSKYPEDQKLIQYLARQGFQFDTIKEAISHEE